MSLIKKVVYAVLVLDCMVFLHLALKGSFIYPLLTAACLGTLFALDKPSLLPFRVIYLFARSLFWFFSIESLARKVITSTGVIDKTIIAMLIISAVSLISGGLLISTVVDGEAPVVLDNEEVRRLLLNQGQNIARRRDPSQSRVASPRIVHTE
eukprot:TRINITY_DN14541_c0_g1_i2.p1 TRINITY_DN14541_c0_g1~~TRINITY_DN14541_c0_g1_i2.p1  ORF type:complete len:153 (-),score=4.54 TRINITY_DN14541_c0_g1_i2:221-679(-)